ncbi:MAG TPA: SLC13 family permease [Gaiellaceae bacterium]
MAERCHDRRHGDPPAGAEARPHLLPAAADQLAGITAAASQAWPAFALITGLLLVGVVAERDGLFAAAGGQISRLPFPPRALLLASLGLVAVVTAVLNLDTSVFFLTPVMLHLARHRGLDETPFLYGTVFMSNAASLFLPGSNLTNLIVLHHERVPGATFFSRMWPAAFAAVLTTALVLLVMFWRALGKPAGDERDAIGARLGVGAVAVALSTVLVLVLAAPALPVLVCGVAAVLLARSSRDRVLAAVNPRVIGGLFVLAVAVGSAGRWWHGPEHLINSYGRWQTAVAGAAGSVGLNNLPAAMLFAAHPPMHPRALLIGLNLGPNLAVTGSLSAVLWLRVARGLDARPSIRTYSLLGIVLVPVSLAAALAALWLTAPGRL